ncbi:sigma-70 family RNA polymerase sigma factor [Alloacidobacterium dinghuense]|uniref:Sigma-70 family RNA polymerase sigma factor n=1 Tax=Alloacidobacterium dinghuense TaxID=2763107 RepID=A0A7G8BKF0_9BACT|nr:sigma-70 family RNA polymerase sigma factor [Alloacidobacterium dinghuense]QNI33020.1 sigma-70 family RNA polymerase sigma factor [Alloacidobacterium dinghuense]
MAKRDDAKFTECVRRHSRLVFRVAYAVLRNSHDAEDVVQEVFLKLYRGNAWDGMRDEKAYLARAAWRVALDHLPKHEPAHEVGEIEIESGRPSPEQTALDADLQQKVHRLIDGLPEELRQPLALSTIQELTSSEVAQLLGIPEGTVRTRVLRARQLLREKLAALEGKNHAARHA